MVDSPMLVGALGREQRREPGEELAVLEQQRALRTPPPGGRMAEDRHQASERIPSAAMTFCLGLNWLRHSKILPDVTGIVARGGCSVPWESELRRLRSDGAPPEQIADFRRVLSTGPHAQLVVMNIPAVKNSEIELFVRDVEGVVRAAEPILYIVPQEVDPRSPDTRELGAQVGYSFSPAESVPLDRRGCAAGLRGPGR